MSGFRLFQRADKMVPVKPGHARPRRKKLHPKRMANYVILATAIVGLASGIVTLATKLHPASGGSAHAHHHGQAESRKPGQSEWPNSHTLGTGPFGLLEPGPPIRETTGQHRHHATGSISS